MAIISSASYRVQQFQLQKSCHIGIRPIRKCRRLLGVGANLLLGFHFTAFSFQQLTIQPSSESSLFSRTLVLRIILLILWHYFIIHLGGRGDIMESLNGGSCFSRAVHFHWPTLHGLRRFFFSFYYGCVRSWVSCLECRDFVILSSSSWKKSISRLSTILWPG